MDEFFKDFDVLFVLLVCIGLCGLIVYILFKLIILWITGQAI